MKTVSRLFLFYCIYSLNSSTVVASFFVPPKVTIVIVVDQGAFSYLQTLKNKFKYGLKRLLNHSFVYANAHFPHAKPETATGHAALNTGTFASYHGFTENAWLDRFGHDSVHCDDDFDPAAAVFGLDGSGKSAHFLEVDGISDRFIFKSSEEDPHRVFSIALKSRSAIAMAGHIKAPFGGVFWFENGMFTSSKAFMDELPLWIKNVNTRLQRSMTEPLVWTPRYNVGSGAYASVKEKSYLFSQEESFFGHSKPIQRDSNNQKNSFFWYQASPRAVYDLFEVAKSCLQQNVIKQPGHTLFWLGCSGLDKLGHIFGPDSYEVVDYLYHLDYALEDFISFLKTNIGKKHFVLVLTADHGISSFPEISAEMGIPAKRIAVAELEQKLQNVVAERFAITDKIVFCDPPYIYLNHDFLETLSKKERKKVIKVLFTSLKNMEGIYDAWQVNQFVKNPQQEDSIPDHFQKQLYKGRVGDFVFQSAPFYTFTQYKKGASHNSPYNQDTHVPLIFYGPKYFRSRYIYDYVNMLQFAPTLSLLLGIEFPSAAMKQTLPHFFSRDPLFDSF